ncbi:MAG: multidrug efflux SMR transporter [Deltaproteobacteria bacterium]|nr:multidrug efflux SMR transporter [Deltaproteobacteria bacterium]
MHYLYLALAIILEVSGTTCMKMSQGFTRLMPSVWIFVFYGFSFTFLTLVLKKLEVSIVYAIWSGLGTALIAAIGIGYFGESVNALKLVSLGLVIAGVVGLNLSMRH